MNSGSPSYQIVFSKGGKDKCLSINKDKQHFLFQSFWSQFCCLLCFICVQRIINFVYKTPKRHSVNFPSTWGFRKKWKKKKKRFRAVVASCHLSSYLVRTFSDLGSVNITQKRRKKKSFPSSYAKVWAEPSPWSCEVSTTPVNFDDSSCSVELASPASHCAFCSLCEWGELLLCLSDKPCVTQGLHRNCGFLLHVFSDHSFQCLWGPGRVTDTDRELRQCV